MVDWETTTDQEWFWTGAAAFVTSWSWTGTVVSNSLPSPASSCSIGSTFVYDGVVQAACAFDGSENRITFDGGFTGGGQPATCDAAADYALWLVDEAQTVPGQLTTQGCLAGLPETAIRDAILSGISNAFGVVVEVIFPGVFEWL